MLVIKDKHSLQQQLQKQAAGSAKIGFIPTLGALHEGHLSLISQAKAAGTIVVCSIFVNPTQFNDPADLKRYPRPLEQDIELLVSSDCDYLFLPEASGIYPEGINDLPTYDLGDLEHRLEGKYRPGHFQGVAQVVDRLLQIVAPDILYLGQKDYQQCLVIQKLLALSGSKTTLRIMPTIREEDGLAMSSRNRLLTEPQRAVAGLIYQCLVSIQSKKNLQQFSVVQKECFELLSKKGFAVDYVELADAETLEPLADYDPKRKMVALIAAALNRVRLIDNLLL